VAVVKAFNTTFAGPLFSGAAGGRPLDVSTPTRDRGSPLFTGETVREIDTLSREQGDRAVLAADHAFLARREWPICERALIVRRARPARVAPDAPEELFHDACANDSLLCGGSQ
jgi:acyl-CoA reductase-like NAD-dependent aldehyde dehydrogenase